MYRPIKVGELEQSNITVNIVEVKLFIVQGRIIFYLWVQICFIHKFYIIFVPYFSWVLLFNKINSKLSLCL